jgi:FtsP/CotA-like multicopper oxidase with cupredoxin domain
MRVLGVILVSLFGLVAAVETSPRSEPIKPRHDARGYQVDRTKWGKYDINTDYYTTTPDTGRTVEVFHIRSKANEQHWLTVDNVTLAPDGVPRQMMVFNNQFPGPLIEANWGDTIVVHVTNNLKNNGFQNLFLF